MDELLREAKEKFILEGQKAYIAINGAGGAAALAFLQALWEKKASALLVATSLGLVCFALGVASGALTYPMRHFALRKKQLNSSPQNRFFNWAYSYLPLLSIFLFTAGLVSPAIGVLCSLPR